MINPLNSFPSAAAIGGTPGVNSTNAAGGAKGPAFKDLLLESLQQVNDMQQAANQAVEQLATGGEANLPEVLTLVQKADISFKMMLQLRNKLVAAYQEVKDMRI